jgi:hypothetical protein
MKEENPREDHSHFIDVMKIEEAIVRFLGIYIPPPA